MTRTIFITGVSSGIGLACTRFFLECGYHVVGIGRRSDIQAANFTFIALDLSNTNEVMDFQFPFVETDEIILLNNAGVIGEIAPSWEQSQDNFRNVLHVNSVSPVILCQSFVKKFDSGLILNISSGAANRPIKGWSAYCASKATLDMFSLTIQEELNFYQKNVIVKSIAPGVVDTVMQEQIRLANPESFPDSQNFHSLYKDNQLETPLTVAKKLDYVINNYQQFPETIFSLREITV